jgi:hypothetical protein
MKTVLQIIITTMLVILISSCRDNAIVETIVSTRVVITATVSLPIVLPPTLTRASHPVSTATLLNSVTPQPTDLPTLTVTLPPTPTIPQATLQILETINPLSPLCEPGGFWELSPNGQWISETECRGDAPNIHSYLKVLNISDGRAWRVDFDKTKLGYEEGVLWPAQWTSDGRFLFVGAFGQFDGGGFEYVNATALLRLNLLTGETTEILPNGYHTYALSVEGEKLAYVSEKGIYTLDLSSWITNRVEVNTDYCRMGDLLWSPDKTKIVAQTRTCAEDDYFDFTAYNFC